RATTKCSAARSRRPMACRAKRSRRISPACTDFSFPDAKGPGSQPGPFFMPGNLPLDLQLVVHRLHALHFTRNAPCRAYLGGVAGPATESDLAILRINVHIQAIDTIGVKQLGLHLAGNGDIVDIFAGRGLSPEYIAARDGKCRNNGGYGRAFRNDVHRTSMMTTAFAVSPH